LKRTVRLAAPLFALLLAALAFGTYDSFRAVETAGQALITEGLSHRLILDAGHGGFDGGAVGVNGAIEKDLNLAITQQTAAIAQLAGFSVTQVRESDAAVCDEGLSTIRKKKVSDLHNRLAMLEADPAAVFVSIHQNHFSQASSRGTQIFFSRNDPRSEVLADRLQKRIASNLQPENRRETKPAGKNLYLLSHAQSPAVLVECGFLSNPEECEMLCAPAYQQQLAFSIVEALLEETV